MRSKLLPQRAHASGDIRLLPMDIAKDTIRRTSSRGRS